MDPVIPTEYVRALRYVALVERGAGRLEDAEIDAYVDVVPPVRAGADAGVAQPMEQRAGSGGHARYLTDLGWVTPAPTGEVRLTELGHAILRAVATEEAVRPEPDAGQPRNTVQPPAAQDPSATSAPSSPSPVGPLHLGTLTAELAGADPGLLVDPYFDDEMVTWLARSTTIPRVLLCRCPEDAAALSAHAAELERRGRSIEFRILPPGLLSDRYLIGADGTVSMIDVSAHGTSIIKVPAPLADPVRSQVVDNWYAAQRVHPATDEHPATLGRHAM